MTAAPVVLTSLHSGISIVVDASWTDDEARAFAAAVQSVTPRLPLDPLVAEAELAGALRPSALGADMPDVPALPDPPEVPEVGP